MHGLAVYVKEGLSFEKDLSLESSEDSYLCFWLALLHPVFYWLFLYRSRSLSSCTVFDSISSNIEEVLSINPSANMLVFGNFDVRQKNWLTFSGGTDRFGEPCYRFSISNEVTQMVIFLLGSQTLTLTVLLFWFYLFPLMLVFWSCCCLSFHWFYIKFMTGFLFSCSLRWSSWSFERCFMEVYI